MGLRAAPRDDSGTSCAELALGTTIRLPGEFIESTEEEEITDSQDYVRRLRRTFRDLRPVPRRARRKEAVFVHPDLHDATHVYLRVGRVRRPLEPPYDGPFRVIKRTKKWFRISIADKEEDVSIDRLKPAYFIDEDENAPVSGNNGNVSILKNNALCSSATVSTYNDLDATRNTQLNSQKPMNINESSPSPFPTDIPTSRFGRRLNKTVRFQAKG